ncbi:MAG: hypothetical protein LBH44_00410 [Treponema sp.]|jgi:hypothetical protein|nr:hypothetical protein [Treponema sp.]
MPRPKNSRSKTFSTPQRGDSKTFQITLNPSCGLPHRICKEWQRRSFKDLPNELADYRSPKSNKAAQAGALALIEYLKKGQAQGNALRVRAQDVLVSSWIEKFTVIDTSPRTDINISENRPPSIDTFENYESYYRLHIKGDPLLGLKMAEVEEQDIHGFNKRMWAKKLTDGRQMGGTRTYVGVVKFVRMAFNNYELNNKNWVNPIRRIKEPKYKSKIKGALSEDEVVRLFYPGVLKDTMELAVCAAMFLSGLRCAEIFALKPECLNWHDMAFLQLFIDDPIRRHVLAEL